MAPFTALYGREPPPLNVAVPSRKTPPEVAIDIHQRGELLVVLRKNLEKAQQRMCASANRHRRDVKFEVRKRVLLKLQLYRQFSVAKPLSSKLSKRFYGPFEVIERIGPVAYRLQLPEGSRIHNVFHVSLLRNFVDDTDFLGKELPPLLQGVDQWRALSVFWSDAQCGAMARQLTRASCSGRMTVGRTRLWN